MLICPAQATLKQTVESGQLSALRMEHSCRIGIFPCAQGSLAVDLEHYFGLLPGKI